MNHMLRKSQNFIKHGSRSATPFVLLSKMTSTHLRTTQAGPVLRRDADDLALGCLQVAHGAVYSLHKTTTRAHIQKVAQRDPRVANAEVLAEMRFDLPATYAFHKQRSTDIAVDLWRIALLNRE